MAIKLHRAGGFRYGHKILINNTDNIFLLDVIRNGSPTKTRYDFVVPKRNGSKTYNNRYENNYIDVVIGIYDTDILIRRQKQQWILESMIETEDKLCFQDEPQYFYNAEIIDAIEVSEGEVFTEITIHFKCSYCKYGSEKTITLANGENKVYNMGNYPAENIIEITALTACDSIIIDNGINSFTLQNLLANEIVCIDSEKMIVYKVVNGVKQSVLTRFNGKFWQLVKGKTVVTLGGTNYSATVKISYKDTYIV